MATRQNSRSDDIDGRAQRARPRRSVGGWNVQVGAVVAFVGIFDCRRMLISLVLATALRYRIFGCRDNFVRATLLLCCVIVLLLLYYVVFVLVMCRCVVSGVRASYAPAVCSFKPFHQGKMPRC